MGDEVLEGYAVQLKLVFDHYAEDEVNPFGVFAMCVCARRLLYYLCMCVLCVVRV